MQIVIDIPDEKSENLIKQMKLDRNFRECKIIELPKEHGRLIDADELIKQLEVMANDEWNKQVGSSKGLEEVIDIVDDISPIIEADRAEGSKK